MLRNKSRDTFSKFHHRTACEGKGDEESEESQQNRPKVNSCASLLLHNKISHINLFQLIFVGISLCVIVAYGRPHKLHSLGSVHFTAVS